MLRYFTIVSALLLASAAQAANNLPDCEEQAKATAEAYQAAVAAHQVDPTTPQGRAYIVEHFNAHAPCKSAAGKIQAPQ